MTKHEQDATHHRIEGRPDLLIEAGPAVPFGRVHRDASNIVRNTVVISSKSVNGAQKKRRYSDQALTQIAAMAEGLPAYANHVAPDLAFKPRDVRDLIGRHHNVRYDASTGKVLSDLHLLEHQSGWVYSLIERLGDQVGNSLVSKGLVALEADGTEVVTEIAQLRSCDLVSDPAATRGLFESVLQEAREAAAPATNLHARLDAWIHGRTLTEQVPDTAHALVRQILQGTEAEMPDGVHARLANAVRR